MIIYDYIKKLNTILNFTNIGIIIYTVRNTTRQTILSGSLLKVGDILRIKSGMSHCIDNIATHTSSITDVSLLPHLYELLLTLEVLIYYYVLLVLKNN